MQIDSLVKNPGCWLSMGEDTGVIISSRIRLARNLAGHAFPGWAGEGELVRVSREIFGVFRFLHTLKNPLFLDMAKVSDLDKDILIERHLISQELADKAAGSGLIVGEDEGIAVMVNEEDHLRLQAIAPGQDLLRIWKRLNELDDALDQHVTYAFSPKQGYLTACPSNIGTGLRASAMLHLSGLHLMDELRPVIQGLEKMGMAVRGLLGEGTEAHGNMFQISNQCTLGTSEQDIVERLVNVVEEVARHEENARTRLFQKRRMFLLDQVSRSLGVLTHARVLSSGEATDYLSGLRLGVHFGFIEGLEAREINEILLMVQPGHLQKMSGRIQNTEERDELRARMMREKLGPVRLRDK
jgi:protein arginine kinase